jgi:hypothetical protein
MWKHGLLAIAGAALLGLTVMTAASTADARDHRRGSGDWQNHSRGGAVHQGPRQRGGAVQRGQRASRPSAGHTRSSQRDVQRHRSSRHDVQRHRPSQRTVVVRPQHRTVVVKQRPRRPIIVRPAPRPVYYRPYVYRHARIEPFAWFAFGALSYALVDRLTPTQHVTIINAHNHAAAAPLGEQIVWSDGGAHGTIVPVREGTSTSGRYCREFYRTVTIGGRSEQAYGTACMQPDGSWELVSGH